MSNETENTKLERRAFMTEAAGVGAALASHGAASQTATQDAGSALRDFEGKTVATEAARGIGLARAVAFTRASQHSAENTKTR